MENIERWEKQLDSFDPRERLAALTRLCEKLQKGEITASTPGTDVNLHCHTFFSYNLHGFSPSKFAWLARKKGLAVAGIVDFDVFDGVDEFLAAARMLGLKACAGMESRVFVPEFSGRVINSPGEPGISYHMGVGFPRGELASDSKKFQQSLFDTAQRRNAGLISRVNKYLAPVELDYEKDVKRLTPAGNVTERHICLAYARKANAALGSPDNLKNFWEEKLGIEVSVDDLPEGVKILNAIRAKTMKRGGVGYVQPDGGSFPTMADMNNFVLAAGGIPTLTWLDGASDGEKAIEELLDIAAESGTAALNIIPDRNYTPGVRDVKLSNLQAVVAIAERRNLPVVVGTEMNSFGNKFVDAFDTEELKPLAPIFLKGAYIVYAHSVLQQKVGLGYVGAWAKKHFADTARKNAFFEEFGRLLGPEKEHCLDGLSRNVSPQELKNRIT